MAGLSFFRGDSVTIPVTISGVDLTGTTVYFTVKDPSVLDTDDSVDTAAIIKAQTSSHSDPTNGKTVIALSSTVTNVTPGQYVYDIQTKDGSGNVVTRVSKPEPVTIYSDVTRRTS